MLAAHLQECEHNPKKPVHCELGCGLVVPKDEIKVKISVKGHYFLVLSLKISYVLDLLLRGHLSYKATFSLSQR